MSTKNLIYLAIIGAIIYYVYTRKKKEKESIEGSQNSNDTTQGPSTATPPIIPTFENVDPADFDKQAFEVV